jgi:hypothetical protein
MEQLDEEDKISGSYREKIERLLDNEFNHDLYYPLNKYEMDKIWEEITTEMDIGEIWKDISSDLDRIMPSGSYSGIFFRLIAAVLIVLFGLIPIKKGIPDPGIIEPDLLIEKTQNGESAEMFTQKDSKDSKSEYKVIENILQPLGNYQGKSEKDHKIAQVKVIEPDLTDKTKIIVSNEDILMIKREAETATASLAISQDNDTDEEFNITPVLKPDGLDGTRVFTGTDYGIRETGITSFSAQSSDRLIDRGRISLGLITSFKNTWLLNHETFDGFRSESLNTTEIVFAPDAGVSLNYALNKNWSLQADAFLYSGAGQEYQGFYDGKYGRKKITLRYSTIDISVKYSRAMKGFFIGPASMNFVAGNYVSILNNASLKKISYVSNIGSQYQKYDFGLRLGTEIEMHLNDHLSVAPGLFVSLGIPNIYKGTVNIPGYFRKTHNGSEGIRLAIYYH